MLPASTATIVASLAAANESLSWRCWDWGSSSSNVCLNGLLDASTASAVIGILSGIVESAGLSDKGLDWGQLGDSALSSRVLEWEDAGLDELEVVSTSWVRLGPTHLPPKSCCPAGNGMGSHPGGIHHERTHLE